MNATSKSNSDSSAAAGSVRILGCEILFRGFGRIAKYSVERRRFDGRMQTFARELYDAGDGAAILLYDPLRERILLVRQFRLPPFVDGGHDVLTEVCAGKLEGEDPLTRIVAEAEEETGFFVREPRRLFEAYMSPGAFSEKLTFFAAQYSGADRISKGGGLEGSDEDIEILEPTLDEALHMIETGEIVDAKTILLLYYAKATGLMGRVGDG
jgi:nudix-type nucleoside diphosphatase (YffH/AdpP family)